MRKVHLNPAGVPSPRARIAQVVAAELGTARLLSVSGQLAFDADRVLIGPGDITAQSHAVLRNIGTILAGADADFGDLVRIGVYLTDITQLGAFNAVLAQYVTDPPASTAVQVAALFHPEALVEVDVQAVTSTHPEK